MKYLFTPLHQRGMYNQMCVWCVLCASSSSTISISMKQRKKVPALSPVDGVHMHHICITVIVYLSLACK